MADVRTVRVLLARTSGDFGSFVRGHLAVERRAIRDMMEEQNGGSGLAHRASQPFGADDQFCRLDHSHVEGQAGWRARLSSLAEVRHHASRERQRTALPRDRHAAPYVAQFDAADAGKTAYYWSAGKTPKAKPDPVPLWCRQRLRVGSQ